MRNFESLKPSAERGLSIVEFMIAMVLGLVLIAGVLQVFLGNRQTQRAEQTISRIEENGRVAMDLITQDLRLTGYYGCSRLLSGEMVPVGKSPVFTKLAKVTTYTAPVSDNFLDKSLRGFQVSAAGTWSPAQPTDLSASPNPISSRTGSDVLSVYFGEPTGMTVTADVSGAADIVLTNPNKAACITSGSQVLISNCAITDFFTVTNTPACNAATMTLQHAASKNSSASLSTSSVYPYSSGSKISQFVDRVYFVRGTGRTSPDGTEIYSLWRRDNGKVVQELVEGVEFLHFMYGELLSDGKIRYVSADTATLNWTRVVSVQVSMLTKSFDSVRSDDDAKVYRLLDQDIGASGTTITHSGKRSLRRVYTATVELRNRVEQ